jgi:hypothetical protein
MTHRTVAPGISVAISTTSNQSSSFVCKSTALRLVAIGGNAFVAIGTDPTATTSDYCIPAGESAALAIDNESSRVTGITTGTTTIVDFPQGQSTPFSVGDYVTLESTAQSYYNFTHVPVISVDSSSGYDGYYSTRIGLGTDTTGIATAFYDTNAVLRNSVKIAAITDSGSGTLYAQQVQISGDA